MTEQDRLDKAKFYYSSKASRRERDAGCEDLYWQKKGDTYTQITRAEYDQLSALKVELKVNEQLSKDLEEGEDLDYKQFRSRVTEELGTDPFRRRQDPDFECVIDRDAYKQSRDIHVSESNIHPTVKPIEVMEWLVNELTPEGGTVLDPFAGSGTTGIAAMKQGRNCRLVELDEDDNYKQIILGRLTHHKTECLEETEVWEDRPEITLEDRELDVEVEEDTGPAEISFSDLFGG